MTHDPVREAILLYEYSGTAQGLYGPVGNLPRRIIRRLWDLYRAGEIGTPHLGGARNGTISKGKWSNRPRRGPDLRVNQDYLDSLPEAYRLAALSMVLVHEGAHAALPFPRMLDELAARQVTVFYFRELSGPGVFNEAADNPGLVNRRSLTVRIPANFRDYDKQSKYLRKGQLVDHMLSIRTYRKRKEFNASWIVSHLSHWGGPANRWSSTRGRYIRVLAKEIDPYYSARILDIMESVSSRRSWDRMMRKAGPLRRIRIALEDLGAENRYAARINALQQRWNVKLTEIGAILD